MKIQKVLEFPPRQQLYIELKDRLRRKTNFTLNLRWYSRLISDPEGFYVDQYDGGNGVKRYIFISQIITTIELMVFLHVRNVGDLY